MSEKRTRSIYVTDGEYEWIKKHLNILRSSASLSYEKELISSSSSSSQISSTEEERPADNHEKQ